jgi:hypothetical protein
MMMTMMMMMTDDDNAQLIITMTMTTLIMMFTTTMLTTIMLTISMLPVSACLFLEGLVVHERSWLLLCVDNVVVWLSQTINRQPGDRWMIRGPVEYVPPVEVEVLMKRQAIPLDENEGIYVRDIKTGKVGL